MSIYGNSPEDKHFHKKLNKYLDSYEEAPESSHDEKIAFVTDICTASDKVAQIALEMAAGDEVRACAILESISFIQLVELKERVAKISEQPELEDFLSLTLDEWEQELDYEKTGEL